MKQLYFLFFPEIIIKRQPENDFSGYLKGEYLPKDLDKSQYWLEKAKVAGHEKAEELLVYCQFLQITKQAKENKLRVH